MRIISPCSEELKRRGLDPQGKPLSTAGNKKPSRTPKATKTKKV